MKLYYKKVELPFEHAFTISGGRTKTYQPSLLIALQLGNQIGYGEAPAIQYYDVTVESMIKVLEEKKAYVEKFALTEPERYWHYLHHLFPNNAFLVSALDMAAWDLFGKMEQKLIYQLWNIAWQNIPLTDYTIGIDTT
ncbi:MAG: dipeptide epimerase, partial [Bacteroidota bacterium]|nr:dipeptide epimerase [Bacteroidota bacterium]